MKKTGSIYSQIFKISIPVIFQNLVNYLLIFTDTIFIGRYNIEGLSAVNNVTAPYFMFLSFFIALGQGITIVISQSIGAKKQSQANRIAETSLFFNGILSLIYFLIWIVFGGKILSLVGAKGNVLIMAKEYVSILAYIYLFFGVSVTISSIFQGIGNTKPTMYASVLKTILNIFLNWVFIFGVWIFPEMGVAGAALGTVLSEFVSVIMLIYFIKKEKAINIRFRTIIKSKWKVYSRVVRIGLPVGLEFMMWTFGNIVLIYLLNQIDTAAAGYYGLLNTLIHLSLNIYIGFGVASLVLIGKYTGAGDKKSVFDVSKKSMKLAMIVCFVLAVFYLLWPSEIISVFTKDTKVISYLSAHMIFMVFIMFPKAGNIMSGSFIRGTGDTKWMMYVQFVGTISHILLALLFVVHFKMGFKGVLIAVLIDELWRSLVNYGKFYFKYKKILKTA